MDSVLRAVEERQASRPVHEFELPKEAIELGDQYIKKSVGLVKLTFQEELEALEIGKASGARAAFFTLVKSFVEVDGRPVDLTTAEGERILNYTDPIIRDLITDAQASLSRATPAGSAAFLKSRKVKV